MKYLLFLLFLLLKAGAATAQNNLVVNGIPWFEENGNRTKVTLSPASHVILRMIL